MVQISSINLRGIHFENCISGACDAVMIRESVGALPCKHLIHYKIALTDNSISFQRTCTAFKFIAFKCFRSRLNAVILRDREKCFRTGFRVLISFTQEMLEAVFCHATTSRSSPAISASSAFNSASISASGRGGTYR